MVDIANFLAQNSPRYNRAQMDVEHSNALLRNNDAARIPQYNRAQDLAISGAEQNQRQTRQENARKVMGDIFTAIGDAQDPISAASTLTRSDAFREAGSELGIQVDQFTADGDPEQLRQASKMWAQAVGSGSGDRRVQSTQVLEDGTIAYITSDGSLIKTPEKARNDLRFVTSGGGSGSFDPRSGVVTPITSSSQEAVAAAERAGAEAWARAAAQAGVDLQTDRNNKTSTLGVWQVAREGLMSALGGTTTGPFAGRIPAVTASQQVADGAIAAVAPVLKQLFRSAGEGVFTDRDQQLLIDMIPNRTDLPEARVAKIKMIDEIIEAKLSAAGSTATPSGGWGAATVVQP